MLSKPEVPAVFSKPAVPLPRIEIRNLLLNDNGHVVASCDVRLYFGDAFLDLIGYEVRLDPKKETHQLVVVPPFKWFRVGTETHFKPAVEFTPGFRKAVVRAIIGAVKRAEQEMMSRLRLAESDVKASDEGGAR